MAYRIRQLVSAFDSTQEIVGTIHARKRALHIYLNQGAMEMGPLGMSPLPEYVRFDETGARFAEQRGSWQPLPNEQVPQGIEILRLYDPRVYAPALERKVAHQEGRRQALAYDMEAMGPLLGMSQNAARLIVDMSGKEYKTTFSRRGSVFRMAVRDGAGQGATVRYRLL